MKLSLVLATISRTQELKEFLRSLRDQEYQNLELIIVDQNQDDRLLPVLDEYAEKLRICRLVSEPGLSKARNVGISAITGDVVGFPDDDCYYPHGLLHLVDRCLEHHQEIDGLTGRVVGKAGENYARFHRRPGYLTKFNVWQRAASSTMFLRRSVVNAVGPFDESLGPGAGTPWLAAEDIDYPLRAIASGYLIYYDPAIVVMHPSPIAEGYGPALDRAYRYGLGIGRVWRKHRFPLWLVTYYLARPLGGAMLSLAQGHMEKARYHWSAFRGRLQGWSAKL